MDFTARTPYDLNFYLWGYPVRVNPFFWIIMACIGFRPGDLQFMAIFALGAFVSILLHEFGHGLVAKAMGCRPVGILLYGMGGLCYYEPRRHLARWEEIVISLAGPFTNFALFGLVWLIYQPLIPFKEATPLNLILIDFYNVMFFVNVFWGIINLFPILPLDGGRVMFNLLRYVNPLRALEWAALVSIGLVLILGILYIQTFGSGLNLVLLAFLLFANVQTYQMSRSQYS